ncbi:hypothetical protein S7335_5605 [Synechococcus sp. PCC 7335]|uniref:WD40 repeat domain-containing protein n=1 Tax=Synechococcus sp. (strain ATCC 29403 / PCC 7335) TaxID=91464 RepID=UPI00017EDD0D|nr:WD40 repeat domain-containing protein [Synechococcus sp. PCC 7335]EDX87892.1 hypothetical protein S7335_5605 [Synechococcus sp. PCC 7335]
MTSEEVLSLVEHAIYSSDRVKRSLSPLQRTVFRYVWEGSYSYGEIAQHSGYELSYVKQTGSQLWRMLSKVLEEKVTKNNVRVVLQRNIQSIAALSLESSNSPVVDWGDAVDISCFYGRQAELTQLTNWVVSDRCRLIGIFGMGGMGKTALSIRLAQQLEQKGGFSRIVWRSLRDAPPLPDLIADLLQVLAPSRPSNQAAGTTQTIGQKLSELIKCLREHRCLIVLDNGETVTSAQVGSLSIASSDHSRKDRLAPGYSASNYSASNYDLFWQQLGQTTHQSAVVLTSREKPTSIAAHEGNTLPVRSLRLTGLPAALGRTLFELRGSFSGTATEWQQLVDYYAGNPLALKMVAAVIQELFNGQLADFLDCAKSGGAIFGDIEDLLRQQIGRLSVLQQQTLDWLAIARQPITISQIRSYFVPVLGLELGELLAALSALERRSLIEKLSPNPETSQPSFTLQPVVMEYATHRLIERVCEQMLTRQMVSHSSLASHALIQAQARDYVRETQTRLILKPIADRLLALSSPANWAQIIQQWLDELRQIPSQIGYAGGNLINLLVQMQVDLSDWDFSRLPIWSAYLKGVDLHRVSFVASDLTHSVFNETFSQVLSVAFSPDGKLLATGDINHEIQIWQSADGKPLLSLTMDEGWVWSVAFSPNGKLIAGSANGAVHLWHVQNGELVQCFDDYSDRVFCVSFSPDGKLLATGSEDRQVKVWDLKTGHLLHQLKGHTDEVRSVAFLPTQQPSSTLASASYDGTVRLWHAIKGECLAVLGGSELSDSELSGSNVSDSDRSDSNRLSSVAFSPDGLVLASGGASGYLHLWHVKTKKAWQLLDAQQPIRSIAFSPDGNTVAVGANDGNIWRWNYRTGESLQMLSGHTSWISAITYSPNQMLASGSEDRSVRIWRGNLCLRQLQGYSNGIWSVAFNRQGTLLASGNQDRDLRLWSVQTGELLSTLRGHKSWIWSVSFSPTRPTVASSSEDQTIRIWDIQSQQQKYVLTGHGDAVLSLLHAPDGSLWSGSLDGTLKQWSEEGICLQTLNSHDGGVWTVALSLDGQLLLSGSQDQTIKLWNPVSGSVIDTLNGHQSWIRSVAMSPDCKTLLSGGADGILKIWQRDRNGKYRCQQTYAAHGGPILSIAIHKNGRQATTSSTDSTIKLWELKTGICQEIQQAHNRWIKSLTYSPDGSTLASCSQDATIKLWQVASSPPWLMLTQTLRMPRPYEALNVDCASGLSIAQRSALKQLGAIENGMIHPRVTL